CESNLARVLLFSTIGILLTLLFIFFLCSIIQICYKKRQSSNRTCSSVVVKSTVSKQDNPENIPHKLNQHPINLSLPKQNYSKLSKIYLNPLFDTDITKAYSMNSKTNPTDISSQSTMNENSKRHRHQQQQHHHILSNQQFPITNIKHNCTNYIDPSTYISSISTMNKTDLKMIDHSNIHKNLSISSIIDFIENSSILSDSLINYSDNLSHIMKQSINQLDHSKINNINHIESMGTSLLHNIPIISEFNDDKSIDPINDHTHLPNTYTSSNGSNQYNLSLIDLYQSNYIPCSNVDSIIHHIPFMTNLSHDNNNNDNVIFNLNNTNDMTNNTECLNHCHCSTFNKLSNTENVLHNSLIWNHSNNNDHDHGHHHHHHNTMMNASSLSNKSCQQCLLHPHPHHCNHGYQINQYEYSKNSPIQLDFNSMTNTSKSC
ncbi:uncharacterized protein DC041_0009527, partial [Schistosoma bovis]